MCEYNKSNQALTVLHLAKEESTKQASNYDAFSNQHESPSSESIDQKPSEKGHNYLQNSQIEGVLQRLLLIILRDVLKHLLCVKDDCIDA